MKKTPWLGVSKVVWHIFYLVVWDKSDSIHSNMHFLKTLAGLSSLAAGGVHAYSNDGPPIDENGIRSIPVCTQARSGGSNA